MCAWQTFQVSPLNPPEGGLLDCEENEVLLCAWRTFQRRRLENVSLGEVAPLNLPQGETFWECKAWGFCVCVVTFQRRRLENDWPPKSPWRGTFRLCGEWDIVWCVANFSTSKTWKTIGPKPLPISRSFGTGYMPGMWRPFGSVNFFLQCKNIITAFFKSLRGI